MHPPTHHTHTRRHSWPVMRHTPYGVGTSPLDGRQEKAKEGVCISNCVCVCGFSCVSPASVWSLVISCCVCVCAGVCMCVCLFQRGAQRTAANNDITSSSINLFLPPTGRRVVGATGRKRECQEWKRRLFEPGGWWVCEGEEGRDEGNKEMKKDMLLLAQRAQVNQGWKGQKKDFIRREESEEASCDLCSPGIWVFFFTLSFLVSFFVSSASDTCQCWSLCF